LPAEIGISVSYPLPGTRFYENVRHQLQEKANWSHSDDLALMFHNTYTPAFYRQLHRYVHSSYRLKLSLRNLRAVVTKPRNSSWGQFRKALSWPYYLPVHVLQWLRLLRLQYIQ
ncbi:MAG TPA: radical SAM protein, partial [Flavisolibacter sp.]